MHLQVSCRSAGQLAPDCPLTESEGFVAVIGFAACVHETGLGPAVGLVTE